MHIVLLARQRIKYEVKMVLSKSDYRDRVTYLVGKGLDTNDLKRAGVK